MARLFSTTRRRILAEPFCWLMVLLVVHEVLCSRLLPHSILNERTNERTNAPSSADIQAKFPRRNNVPLLTSISTCHDREAGMCEYRITLNRSKWRALANHNRLYPDARVDVIPFLPSHTKSGRTYSTLSHFVDLAHVESTTEAERHGCGNGSCKCANCRISYASRSSEGASTVDPYDSRPGLRQGPGINIASKLNGLLIRIDCRE